jgi:predicted transcriptional regulator
MTNRKKPARRRTPTPLVAVDKTVSRGDVCKVLAGVVADDGRTQEEIAALAGITARQLRNVLKLDTISTAVHVLRCMGYTIIETVVIKGEPDG